jgi:hypothetical protein
VLITLSASTTYYVMARSQRAAAITAAPVASRVAATAPAAAPADAEAAPTSAGSAAPATAPATAPIGQQAVAAARLASTSAAQRPGADEVYGREIARLHAVIAQRSSGLDTATINVIERNLKVIDDAIAQCRVALARDPASRYLSQSLNNALETKVELLRTAAQLPAHT